MWSYTRGIAACIKGEIMLCVLLKNVTQNKIYDPGISSHVLWDPGEQLFNPSP
jgi:hypothetical protein